MRASFHSYLTQRILWKKVAMARAAGIVFVAPALLRRCAVMAPRFAARTWSVGEDYSRHLQREAMAKDLPAQVLWRAKIDDENIAPAAWLGGMHAAVETATNGLAAVRSLFSPEEFSAAHDYYPYPLAQAALMSRIFLETPPREQPPLWEDLAP